MFKTLNIRESTIHWHLKKKKKEKKRNQNKIKVESIQVTKWYNKNE